MPDKICEKSKCTACFACQNICPTGAVTLQPDENGCVYPVINEKCTDCGLCINTCPANNPISFSSPQKAYAYYSNNDKIRSDSASGGLVYSIAESFDGIVYGAAFNNGPNAEHIRVDKKDELKRIQGSKYVHSHINNAYRQVKADLNDGKRVLFTGTPCQVGGLKAFLKKDEPLLFTVDLVCHGVPEAQTLTAFLQRTFKSLSNNAEIRFRDEKGWNMTLWENGKKTGEIPFSCNYYYHAFMEGWNYRENCYTCPYAKKERCGDLTAFDFWGITDSSLNKELKKGLNGVFINTEKGAELFDSVKDGAFFTEREISEAVKGNGQLRHPTPETKYSKRFRALNSKRGAYYALINTKIKKRIVFTLRKLKNAGNSNH